MKRGYDPQEHLNLGRALAPLRDEGILILGSGLSYHNLSRFDASAARASSQFDEWLQDSLLNLEPTERLDQLIHWTRAPAARIRHPREDHFIPLMVVVGAAEQDPATLVYHEKEFFGGITVSSFRFGN